LQRKSKHAFYFKQHDFFFPKGVPLMR